ncbi:MAG: hypothetical protein ABC596_05810 [Candidatus Methanosuratincola petrocarbonis]
MPKKTYTVADLKMGRIEIEEYVVTEGGVEHRWLRLTRYYQFVDESGNALPELIPSGITIERKLDDVPPGIRTALNTIANFTYQEAKKKEGL